MAGEQIYIRQPKGAFKGDFTAWDQYRNPILSGSPASSTATSAVGANGFTATPDPQSGTGAFGLVPGPIGVPQPYNDLSAAYPNLSGTNTATSSALLSRLRGELSPGAQSAISDAAATYGQTSGMPGSGIVQNRNLRDIGLTSEQVQQSALQEYPSIMSSVSGTQTVNPALQAEIAGTNATNAAAPNPSSAAYYSRWLFQRYQDLLKQNQPKTNKTGAAIGGTLGAVAGAYFGGPAGASVGYGAGSQIGGMF